MSTKKSKNPKTFNTPVEYLGFESKVKSKFRYFHDTRTKEFLDAVLVTSKNREKSLRKGLSFWRAQLGSVKSGGVKYEGEMFFQDDVPYPPERMKPLVDRAKEGRANPKGIPYLYLSTKKMTAIQEIRPWSGSLISVALFEIVRDLKVVDCSKNIHKLDGTGHENLYPNMDDWRNRKLSGNGIEKYAWSWIDRAFSMPVDPSDDKAGYVPTQILAELFKANNYDGIIFNSLFAEGKNLILFDISSAKLTDRYLVRVTNIPPFDFQEVIPLSNRLAPKNDEITPTDQKTE